MFQYPVFLPYVRFFARLDPDPILLSPCPLACRYSAFLEHFKACPIIPAPAIFKFSNKKPASH
jgi:hypothetical protein